MPRETDMKASLRRIAPAFILSARAHPHVCAGMGVPDRSR